MVAEVEEADTRRWRRQSPAVSLKGRDYRSLHPVLDRVLLERAADHQACRNNVPPAVGAEIHGLGQPEEPTLDLNLNLNLP